MAEPPRRRLPATFQREGMAQELETAVAKGREVFREKNSDFKLIPEVEDEVADLTMSSEELENDDLLDVEEEYRKEMEEERLADEKNGHFTESPMSENYRSTSQGEVPAHVLEAFARVVRSSSMQLNNHATSGEVEQDGRGFRKHSQNNHEDLHSRLSGEHGGYWNVKSDNSNSKGSLGFNASGVKESFREMEELHGLEDSFKEKDILPSSMIWEKGRNGCAESSSSFGGDIQGEKLNMMTERNLREGNSRGEIEIAAAELKKLHGFDNFINVQPISAVSEDELVNFAESSYKNYGKERGNNYADMENVSLPHGEASENLILDLMEARSSNCQQQVSEPKMGSYAAADISSKAQVNNLITSYNSLNSKQTSAQNKKYPQPAPTIPELFPKPKSVNHIYTPAISSTKNQPITPKNTSKPPLSRNTAQTKLSTPSQDQFPIAQTNNQNHNIHESTKNISQPSITNSVVQSIMNATSFATGVQNQLNELDGSEGRVLRQEEFVREVEMEDFPPLEALRAVKGGVHGSRGKGGSLHGEVIHQRSQPAPSLNHKLSTQNSNSVQEVEMMETDQNNKKEADKVTDPGQQHAASPAPGEQPNIQFGRSMADVLRSRQPVEGPIFLDREKAEKRGEVRIVEGKPCLFFSANETSLLAGRLGPAIVGKFSHSIPPAHQIQKSLGKIKLFGTMSWNFLNAKHIFIQLSDMRDYVKILNGPNNSPVWYIEHHPMRVFKWTPEFDPYFESPIITAWCNILALPVHLFEESSLIAIGEMLGKPVQVDRATINRTRVSFARICVEVDLSRPIVEEIDIDFAGKKVTLKVKWEKIPLYCSECRHVGHSASTCYAAGKRPMPPKRDYSRGPPHMQGWSTPTQEPQPAATSSGLRGQPQVFRQQTNGNQTGERSAQVGGRPLRQEGRSQDEVTGARPVSAGLFHGSSSTAAEGTQAVSDDGFIAPKKKKGSRTAEARRRYKENRRARRQVTGASLRRASDGEGEGGMEDVGFSTESEREARSLSPSRRSGNGVSPLALVLHDTNMFGALEDEPSDDNVDSEDQKDYRMAPSETRIVSFARPGGVRSEQNTSLSPPPRGLSKRARLSALRTQ